MERIELQIVALTNSESHQGLFALILEDVQEKKRIPITIGPSEAQSIAVFMEKMKTARPQTHDLYVSTIGALNAALKEVVIHAYEDERYLASLILIQNSQEIIIDARTSDAVAVASRLSAPIYMEKSLFDKMGFSVEEVGLPISKRGSYFNYPLNELEELLEKVLAKEDYESAGRIRDAIRRKKATK
tara:strand:+ start:16484 stop:17044 length:561 start_codon:yes stop_codon:yes gene_type:complete